MIEKDFTQNQGHGLFWDSEIRELVFKLAPCKNDTKKYDVSHIENIFNKNEDVSIKVSSNDGLGGGDILRFFNIDTDKKCTIILIKYKQVGSTKKIKEVLEIDYTLELKNYLFGNVTEEVLTEYVNMIKSIPAGRASSEAKKAYKDRKKEIQKEYNMVINISPKVDSKSQRRVQCAISNVDVILEKFSHCVITRTNKPELRGVVITESIKSEPRKRNKKN